MLTKEYQGASRAQFEHLRSGIIHCLAMVEALIDFGEGEDLEEGVFEQGLYRVFYIHTSIEYGDSQSQSISVAPNNPGPP